MTGRVVDGWLKTFLTLHVAMALMLSIERMGRDALIWESFRCLVDTVAVIFNAL